MTGNPRWVRFSYTRYKQSSTPGPPTHTLNLHFKPISSSGFFSSWLIYQLTLTISGKVGRATQCWRKKQSKGSSTVEDNMKTVVHHSHQAHLVALAQSSAPLPAVNSRVLLVQLSDRVFITSETIPVA